jgi:8-oxo-dGTP pyrophosphatase MutT (NUDIX family)
MSHPTNPFILKRPLEFMDYDKNQVHYLTATAILVKDGKYLIAKRAEWEKAFPGKWTVPGGKLKVLDYVLKQKDTSVHWYNVIEDLVKREVMEEVGLGMKNIGYVTSLAYMRDDEIPSLIISLYGEPEGDEVKLSNELTDYKWVSLEEAKNYELIDGIYEELEILDKKLAGGETSEWSSKGRY